MVVMMSTDENMTACTNGDSMIIGVNNSLVKYFPNRELRHYAIQGLRVHETAHVLFTDFKTIEDAEVEKLRGAEVLVVNALRFAPHPSHFNLAEALALIRRVGPREAYITHMSHEIGLHAATETMLPEGVHLAYDTLEIEINEQYENTQG